MKIAILALLLFFTLIQAKEPDPAPTFPQWKKLHKLNLGALESDAHRAYLDIYVNDLAKEAYETRASSFKVGSQIFKPLYPNPQRDYCARLTIMIKMPKGYDPQNGDWWYGVYDETGTEAWYRGKIRSCIVCHKMAQKSDYLFTESVMEDIELQRKKGAESQE